MTSRYQPLLTPAPARLINAQRQPVFGLFTESVPVLAMAEFDFRSVMDVPLGGLRRHFAQKQFQFVSVCGTSWVDGAAQDWLLAVAIADVRYVSSGFVYFFQNGQLVYQQGCLRPLQFGCQMSASPLEGLARLQAGRQYWQFQLSATGWQLEVQCGAISAKLLLQRSTAPSAPSQAPLALCAPTGYQGFTYTEKNNALAVSGQLQVAGREIALTQARGGYDFSAGFMRRHTNWRWASINTLLDGEPFGLNLAAGVNETGLCENACWHRGHIQHLSPAQFQFERYPPMRQQQSKQQSHTTTYQPWSIATLCGEVSLTFTPVACREEKIQTGLLASNFRQYIGYYQGTVQRADGQLLELKNCLGLAEDHYATW